MKFANEFEGAEEVYGAVGDTGGLGPAYRNLLRMKRPKGYRSDQQWHIAVVCAALEFSAGWYRADIGRALWGEKYEEEGYSYKKAGEAGSAAAGTRIESVTPHLVEALREYEEDYRKRARKEELARAGLSRPDDELDVFETATCLQCGRQMPEWEYELSGTDVDCKCGARNWWNGETQADLEPDSLEEVGEEELLAIAS